MYGQRTLFGSNPIQIIPPVEIEAKDITKDYPGMMLMDSLEYRDCKYWHNDTLFSDVVMEWHDTTLIRVFGCKNGIPEHGHIEFWPDRTTKEVRVYKCVDDVLYYSYETFYRNGIKESFGSSKAENGICVKDTVQMKFQNIFGSSEIENLIDGGHAQFRKDGSMEWYYFVENEKVSFLITYHENMQRKTVAEYDENQRKRKDLAYYENGQLKYAYYFKNGIPSGTWMLYNEKGRVYGKLKAKRGNTRGFWTDWEDTPSGAIMKKPYRKKMKRPLTDWELK